MRARALRRRASRPRALGALAVAGVLALTAALVLTGALSGRSVPSAVALPPYPPTEATTPQADGSVPARQVVMIGATPEEAGAPGANETWGVGVLGDSQHALVRYFQPPGQEGTWTYGPPLPSHFTPVAGPLAGEMTPTGFGALLGAGEPGTVLTRRPGGSFEETQPVPTEGSEALLKEGELLAGTGRAPLLAALQEESGRAGALVVPVATSEEKTAEAQVLHWNGEKWTSEPIELPAPTKEDFRVLAIAASSPTNAWLLGQLARSAYPGGAVALFRRVEEPSERWVWRPVALKAGSGDGEAHALTVPVQGGEQEPFTVAGTGEPPTAKAQLLTVSSAGVWIDGERGDVKGSETAGTTLFFSPEGSLGGTVRASWCRPQAAGTPACTFQLSEPLPSSYSRSFAWPASGEPYGARVITGLREGVSMRLEGESFTRVLSLGAGHTAGEDPGAEFGAAFSSPTEGWLGEEQLPVHITEQPSSSRLAPWPVPFRTPLLAIAPEPGAPVGSLSSEALAVGVEGAVARYKPGQGWLPETLFGPDEKIERQVQLRAVAWPTPTRAYAVGDHGQMWLWRAEVGLWEKDPATPINFRANLVDIAFDPNDSSRGYAVGTDEVGLGGVLLRYGKTWTEETELPSQVQGAAFTSIAFAGSEAIVAYRRQPNPDSQTLEGGLLVNNGSGWQVDEEAAKVMGSSVPRSVAGLPDGGAAVLTESRQLYERESATSPWQATPIPPIRGGTSLSLFREGGGLRAIVAGGSTGNLDLQPAPPPGFPPDLYEPLGSGSVGPESPVVLRQTADGWTDDSHELDPVKQPEGGYHGEWDMPYRPDPVQAVLIDPTGTQGWAVGGSIDSDPLLETGDIERYPADGVKPPGINEDETVPIEAPAHAGSEAKDLTFALGGHAECENPCAARARAGVGPQVWLTSAVALARKIGARAFIYTGPSVSAAAIEARERQIPVPFAAEFERNASILADGASTVPSYVVATPRDLDARPESEGTEKLFREYFGGLDESSADGITAAPGLSEPQRAQCASERGCQASYYALQTQGPGQERALVIVLDDSSEVGPAQREWIAGELEAARQAREPAIAVGDQELSLLSGPRWAKEVATLLVDGPPACDGGCAASAYFYDSPEENVERPLEAGGRSIESFGSGTLGYIQIEKEEKSDFHGASGILLAQVEMASYDAQTNQARVSARLIPVIGELALEPKQGTLLRRSSPALFAGLARRPRAGSTGANELDESRVDPYIPIPEECVGKECAVGVFPEYTFTSSDPEIGNFVERNTASASPLAVLQGPEGKPIPDPQSGLFCAYNAGTTTVTISAGGMSASLPVTVQAGSVRQPCGTQPLKAHAAAQQQSSAPAPPAPAPTPASPAPASAPPPIPLPPPPAPAPPAPPPAARPPATPFVPLAAPLAPVLAFVPPPVPTPARPTPPTGTSAVTSPVEVAEREEEQEEATEQISNQAAAYGSSEHEPAPAYVLGVIVLAALAGAGVRRPRRGRREVRLAHARVSSAERRHQRRRSW